MGIFFTIVLVAIVGWIWQKRKAAEQDRQRRQEFAQEFHVAVPQNFILKSTGVNSSVGVFSLGYPQWEYAKADGTKDERRNDNHLHDSVSALNISKWNVACNDPMEMYSFVTALRAAGANIQLIPREQAKMRSSSVIFQARGATSVSGLVQTFLGKPDLFRRFCIDLCRQQGYIVNEDSKYGFDFSAELGGVNGLVACSCVNIHSKVGLPAVRSLVDANVLEGKQELMYMTTGGYSAQAIGLAGQEGVHLIDGNQLLGMVRQAWGGTVTSGDVPYTEYMLTTQEILEGYPADARP